MQRKSSVKSAILFFCLLITCGYIFYSIDYNEHQSQKRRLDQLASVQAATIERRLTRSLSSTFILAQEVRRSKGEFEDFDKYAKEVINAIGGISNLQLAPDGVIRQIFPLKGNEKAIGHNVLKDDKRRLEAAQAIKDKKLTLAGPFELVQGGIAIIARNPVFLEGDSGSKFWGFTSALIFLQEIIDHTDLKNLENNGIAYQLSKLDSYSGKKQIFAQSIKQPNASHPTTPSNVRISIPNGFWTLSLFELEAHHQINFLSGILVSIIVSAIIALLAYRIFQEPLRLQLLVREKTKDLEYQAFHDDLTGLFSRSFFQETLGQVTRNAKEGERHALLYIDLDDFKKINDTMGHDTGDSVLIEAAERIKSVVGPDYVVARLGGDEFALFLPDLDNRKNTIDIEHISKQITDKLSQTFTVNKNELYISASVGITITPNDGEEAEELMRNADLALYSAKSLGKNCYEFFNSGMKEKALKRLNTEVELRNAITNDEFFLVYQPIVCLHTNKVVKLEALIRWNHPQKGVVSPFHFIDVAEQSGLIVPIGEWVVREACQFIRHNTQNKNNLLPIAINISARQFSDKNFSATVTQIFESAAILPNHIEFEITETLIMEDIEYTIEVLHELQLLGISFSMDDFGTGYSSLAQLRKLPVTTLKIDQSFVSEIEHNNNDIKIIEAIVAMSYKLGLQVITEGIETEAQLKLVKQAGCNLGQGYLFSHPVAPDELDFATMFRSV